MATQTLAASSIHSANLPDIARIPSRPNETRQLADVVRRAQNGDQDAFAELYGQHKKHVFSICMRMVRNFPLAEDLTQETFLQVHRKLGSFRGDSVFSTWLHRTAVNIVLMHLRKRVLNAISLDQMMADIPDDNAGRRLGKRDLAQAGVIDRLAINQVIESMAPGYRSIFILHDVHGFDHGEIASMLDCSSGNTKSQLHKARRFLRGALTTQSRSVSELPPARQPGPAILTCPIPCAQHTSGGFMTSPNLPN